MTPLDMPSQKTSARPRSVLRAVLIAVALAGAFAAGRYWAPAEGEAGAGPRDRASGPAGDPALADADREAEVASLRRQVVRLEQQVKAAETRAKLQAALAGANRPTDGDEIDPDAPVPWPEDTPELYREDSFRRIVNALADQAGPQVKVLEVDCDEAPCYAALEAGTGPAECKNLARLPAWQEPYHGYITMGDWQVTCDDGSSDKVCILGKSWQEWSFRTREHIMERYEARIGRLRESWTCPHEK
jgi:hypothetical protein